MTELLRERIYGSLGDGSSTACPNDSKWYRRGDSKHLTCGLGIHFVDATSFQEARCRTNTP